MPDVRFAESDGAPRQRSVVNPQGDGVRGTEGYRDSHREKVTHLAEAEQDR